MHKALNKKEYIMMILLATITALLLIIVIYLIGGINVTVPRVIGAIVLYYSWSYLYTQTALGM